MKSPFMRNDRANRLDFRDKIKKQIELKLREEERDAIKGRNKRSKDKT